MSCHLSVSDLDILGVQCLLWLGKEHETIMFFFRYLCLNPIHLIFNTLWRVLGFTASLKMWFHPLLFTMVSGCFIRTGEGILRFIISPCYPFISPCIQDLHVFWCPIKSHHISLVVINPVLIPLYMNPIKIIYAYIYIFIPLQYYTLRFPKMVAPPKSSNIGRFGIETHGFCHTPFQETTKYIYIYTMEDRYIYIYYNNNNNNNNNNNHMYIYISYHFP